MTKRPSSIYNDPGYFYSRKLLIRLFTFSSLALVVGITWWIWDDFDRPWKHDQRRELKWEAKRFQAEEMVLERLVQADQTKYKEQLAVAEEKVKARAAELKAVDEQIKEAKGAFYLVDMTYKEQKQYTSEADYQVREVTTTKELAEWLKALWENRDSEDRLRDARKMADDRLRALEEKRKGLQAEIDAVRAEERKNPDLKRLAVVRANIEKKKGYSPLREIPLLDFLAPPTKVNQIVLDNLVDNYEFSTPKKVDRCTTCHVLTTEVGYEKARWPVETSRLDSEQKDPKAFEAGAYRFVYGILDGVDPDKPAANDPFRRELDKLRRARLHRQTLGLLFVMDDEDTGEIKLDKDKNKIWKKYYRDPASGHWLEDTKGDKGGDTIGGFYRSAVVAMQPHWRTHPFSSDMVGAGSPHPFEKFGCTICHQGRGWSTDFGLAYHSPDLKQISNWMTDERAHEEGYHLPLNAGQTLEAAMSQGALPGGSGAGASDIHTGWVPDEATAERWEHEQGVTESKLHYWTWPQLPKSLVQSTCLKCHREGLYRTAPAEYEGVHVGKPVKAPNTLEFDEQSAVSNPELLADPSRMLIPAEPKRYRPEQLERGLDNFTRFGCYGCHKVDPAVFPFMKNVRPKVGWPLDGVFTKTTKEFAQRWVRNPPDFRAETRMPRFFNLSNSSHTFRYRFADTGNFDEVSGVAWADAEIYAIVEWIFEESKARAPVYPPVDLSKGDAKRGEQYVVGDGLASENLGKACIACHDIDVQLATASKPGEPADGQADASQLADAIDKASGRPTGWKHRMGRRQAPALAGIASKVTAEWLVAWLKNPRGYWHDTNMPDLRLTDQEALDIAAFLMTKRNTAFEALPGVAFDQGILDRIAEELKVSEQQESTEAAVATVKGWAPRDRVLYVGKKLFKHYGCFGCHTIEAYKDATPIGTELTDWGSKLIDRLEFNHVPVEHTRFSFAYTKLMNPRIYDLGMPRADRPFERLKMGRFGFSPEEARDLAVFLVALTSDPVPAASLFAPDTREADIIRGREIIHRYNCQGCHVIEDEGGDIWPAIGSSKWRPPDLKGQGRKTQPLWLFRFLKDPAFVTIPGEAGSDRIRPWHSIRMPTFHLSDEEARALVRYFAALSQVPADFETGEPDSLEGPASQYKEARRFQLSNPDDREKKYAADARNRLEEARFTFQEYQCKSCHSAQTKPDSAAPNFRHARAGRLRDTWIEDWLWGPKYLQPGTAMPVIFVDSQNNPRPQDAQFFGGSPDEQIRALRDFVRHHYREEDR